MTNELIAIGKIVAPHGVRGDVRVVPLTDYPERFFSMKQVRLGNGKTMSIESAKHHKQYLLIKFEGVSNRDAVEVLRGQVLYVTREELVPLPQGEYYVFDIVGLDVIDINSVYYGVIADVIQTGSNDVYVAEREGHRPLLIPALKAVVKNIDIPGKRIIICSPEEWDASED